MSTDTTWEPFGVAGEEYDQAPERDGVRVLNLKLGAGKQENRAGRWLGSALVGLGVLALSAAAVSYAAQYVLVFAAKQLAWSAALEAGIPDVGSMIFASLGIALAMHGKRAIRARALNVACVGLSLGMNALAAGPGWRDMAIWVMPSAVYALASDTLIGVIRAYALAKQRELQNLADDEATPLAIVGGVFLWLLRLSLALPSTLSGFRNWVIECCPVAPGRAPAAVTAASTEAARAIEAAHGEMQAEVTRAQAAAAEQVTAAQRERDQAVADAQQKAVAASASAQAFDHKAIQAQQEARSAHAELERAREDAERLLTQVREDSARQRDELRSALEARTQAAEAEAARREREHSAEITRMQDATRVLEQARSEVTRERDELRAGLAARTAAPPARHPARNRQSTRRGESKTARFMALVKERYGDLAGIDPAKVSRICTELAPEIGLNVGAARSALLPRVRAARAGGAS